MIRALYDVNVVLDVLGARAPYVEESAGVLALAEMGVVRGFLAAHTVTTLHYLLSRSLGRADTRKALTDLLRILDVVPVDNGRLQHAMALGWNDFEDAVQASCAEHVEAAYLVTRNKRDFRGAATRVVTPGELVALVGAR